MNDNVNSSKRVVKNTFMLYIRQIVILFLNLYTVRQVLLVLGETDYGVYTVVAGIVTMFSVLSNAMSQANQRFFSYDLGREDYGQLNKTFSLSLLIHVVISVMVLLLTETIGLWYVSNKLIIPDGRYDTAMFVYQSAIIVLLMTIVITPYMAMVLAKEDMNIYAIVSIVEAVLKLFSIIAIAHLPGDRLLLYGLSFIVVEVCVVLSYFGVRKFKYKDLKFVKKYDKSLLKELASFAGWNLFGTLIYPLKVQGINIIYNQSFGTGVVAGRGIAASVNSAVTSFYTNFGNAIRPQIVKKYALDGDDGVISIVYASSKLTYFLMFAIMFPLISEMELVLGLWLGNIPQYATVFSQLTLIEALIESVSNPIMALVDATGRIRKYQLVVGGLQLCNLPLTIIFSAHFKNPLVTYIIAIILALICLMARVAIAAEITDLKVKDFWLKVIARVIVASGIPTVIIWFIKKKFLVEGIVIIPLYALFEILLLVVFYVICFDKKEKEFLWKVVKRK